MSKYTSRKWIKVYAGDSVQESTLVLETEDTSEAQTEIKRRKQSGLYRIIYIQTQMILLCKDIKPTGDVSFMDKKGIAIKPTQQELPDDTPIASIPPSPGKGEG